MTTEIVTVDSIDFPVATYRNARVVTTELLAQAYGTEPVRIQQGYARNQDRFVEGKHFFKLVGNELKDFVTIFKVVANPGRVRNLILWTERGAARHAKILETDQAWEVFEKLEDAYFLPVERPTPYALKDLRSKKALPGGLTIDQIEAVKALVKARVDELPHEYQGGAAITCWSALKTKFGVTYKAIPPEQFSEALSLVARLDLRGTQAEPVMPSPERKATQPHLTYDYAREQLNSLYDWGKRALPQRVQEDFFEVLKELERSLVRGWTEMDKSCLHLAVSMAMLRRWKNAH